MSASEETVSRFEHQEPAGVSEEKGGPPGTSSLERYTGDYSAHEGLLRIEIEHDRLVGETTAKGLALTFVLEPVRDNEFVMRTDDDQLDRAAVTFRTSDERRVTMLVAGHAFAFKQ